MFVCSLATRVISRCFIAREGISLRHFRLSTPSHFWNRKKPETSNAESDDPLDRMDKPHTSQKDIMVVSQQFKQIEVKDKDTFLSIVENFNDRVKFKRRQGEVEFVYSGLRSLKEYGLHRDLDAYKALMEVFPKEKMVARNFFQAGSTYYPKHQACAVALLDEMEYHLVIPDKEMEQMVIERFGKHSRVWRKIGRQVYWFSKFKNANPFPMPEVLPDDALELAKIALKRMSIDLQAKLAVYTTENIDGAVDNTWIVSSQSPTQQQILGGIKAGEPIYVKGPFRSWLRHFSITYFVLRSSPMPDYKYEEEDDDDPYDIYDIPLNIYGGKDKTQTLAEQRNMHMQPEGAILGLCATGTSSSDSLLSWVRILELSNPNMKNLQVLFTLKAPSSDVSTVNESKMDTGDSTDQEQEPSKMKQPS